MALAALALVVLALDSYPKEECIFFGGKIHFFRKKIVYFEVNDEIYFFSQMRYFVDHLGFRVSIFLFTVGHAALFGSTEHSEDEQNG